MNYWAAIPRDGDHDVTLGVTHAVHVLRLDADAEKGAGAFDLHLVTRHVGQDDAEDLPFLEGAFSAERP